MGASKTDSFTDQQNELAILAKALGHPARIAIIEYLLKVDACICGDIVNELPAGSKTVTLNGNKYYVSPDDVYYEETAGPNNTIRYKVVGK